MRVMPWDHNAVQPFMLHPQTTLACWLLLPPEIRQLLGQEGTRKTASSWNYLPIIKRFLYEISTIKVLYWQNNLNKNHKWKIVIFISATIIKWSEGLYMRFDSCGNWIGMWLHVQVGLAIVQKWTQQLIILTCSFF